MERVAALHDDALDIAPVPSEVVEKDCLVAQPRGVDVLLLHVEEIVGRAALICLTQQVKEDEQASVVDADLADAAADADLRLLPR